MCTYGECAPTTITPKPTTSTTNIEKIRFIFSLVKQNKRTRKSNKKKTKMKKSHHYNARTHTITRLAKKKIIVGLDLQMAFAETTPSIKLKIVSIFETRTSHKQQKCKYVQFVCIVAWKLTSKPRFFGTL